MSVSQIINQSVRRFPAWPIYIVGLLPGVWVFYLALMNKLGADPLKHLEHELGELGLKFLILGLAISPLRQITGVSLIKYRRAIGLVAFIYVFAHLIVYLWLDQQFWWGAIYKDLTKRPYIIIGMLAFMALVPLAYTSRDSVIRKMGPVKWRRLHRLVYIAALAGALHYLLLKKTWQIEPMIYLGVVCVLLAWRFWHRHRA